MSRETILNMPDGNFLDQLLGLLHIGNEALLTFTMEGFILSLISTKYINLENRKKLTCIIILVASLLLTGFITYTLWIVSKIQATPPWIFYCCGITTAVYGLIYWLVEKGKGNWFNIIKMAGTATLTYYLVPYVVYSLSSLLNFQLPEWMTASIGGILNCVLLL